MAITNLKLLRCHGVERLSQLVSSMISDGYQPYGEMIEFQGGDVGYVVIQGSPGDSVDASNVNVAEDTDNGITAGDLQTVLSDLAARITALEPA